MQCQMPGELVMSFFISDVQRVLVCLQAGFLTGFFSRALPAVRNRLLLDPRFLFKVGVEVGIDAGMAICSAGLQLMSDEHSITE